MSLPPPRLYTSPIDHPAARCGKFTIEHQTISGSVTLLSLREWITTGRKATSVVLEKPLKIHVLSEDDVGVWMTDTPHELRQAAEWILSSGVLRGNQVLVGGLGLGIVATWLVERHCAVTVVESEADVIALAKVDGATIVHDDIRRFVSTTPTWPFGHTFLDTWQGTSEGTWWTTVLPLRRTIANRFGRQRVHCWAEDQMLGQVGGSLRMGNPSVQKALMGTTQQRGWYYHAFGDRELSDQEIKSFLHGVGLPIWEKRWGQIVDDGIAYVAHREAMASQGCEEVES